jgi:hypothetical protein
MPLSRLNDGFEVELEGIAFGMVDRQGHRWRCLITDRVLSDAIGGAPTQKDKTAWFRAKGEGISHPTRVPDGGSDDMSAVTTSILIVGAALLIALAIIYFG